MSTVAIIGQGLAGSLLAWELWKRGMQPTIYDAAPPSSSSRIAPGVINPLVGKRKLAVSWNARTCFPAALRTFREIEEWSGLPLVRNVPVVRAFASVEARQHWEVMKGSEEARWLNVHTVDDESTAPIAMPWGGVIINDVVVVSYADVIDAIAAHARAQARYVVGDVADAATIDADVIVWCEGWTMLRNPLWNWLPLQPVKGEVVDVEIDGLTDDTILAGACTIVPMGNGRFRVGATYDWDDLTDTPTEAARVHLVDACEHMIGRPVRVVDHRAAVRPAAQSKRPYLGRHPLHEQHVLLNGFGTKGGLVGPTYAAQLVAHLLDGAALDDAVNIHQWWNA